MKLNLSIVLFISLNLIFARPATFQGRVIYHQTMSPSWLEAEAKFIDSSRVKTADQLTFISGSLDRARLLKIPLVATADLQDSDPVTVEITVVHNITMGERHDSDIRYGVSDGTNFVGFETCNKGNYDKRSPCYGVEATSGATISGPWNHAPFTPKPRDSFYPGRFLFTLKLDEGWGSCYTAHDGGFTREFGYKRRLLASKGLSLEVYKDNKGEKVGIKYIKVTIMKDEIGV